MPIVSQAFAGGPPGTVSFPPEDHEIEGQLSERWHGVKHRGNNHIDQV